MADPRLQPGTLTRSMGPLVVFILVTAAAPRVPEPLLAQLTPGGRLVIPVGDLASQELVVLQRTSRGIEERSAGGVRFVPLISRLAFAEEHR